MITNTGGRDVVISQIEVQGIPIIIADATDHYMPQHYTQLPT